MPANNPLSLSVLVINTNAMPPINAAAAAMADKRTRGPIYSIIA